MNRREYAVILMCDGEESRLKSAVKNCLSQTAPPAEIIVVAPKSLDLNQARQLSESNGVSFASEEVEGALVSRGLNRVVRRISLEYLCLFSTYNILETNVIERLFQTIEQFKQYDVSSAVGPCKTAAKRPWRAELRARFERLFGVRNGAAAGRMSRAGFCPRRSAWEEYGPDSFDVDYPEEGIWLVRREDLGVEPFPEGAELLGIFPWIAAGVRLTRRKRILLEPRATVSRQTVPAQVDSPFFVARNHVIEAYWMGWMHSPNWPWTVIPWAIGSVGKALIEAASENGHTMPRHFQAAGGCFAGLFSGLRWHFSGSTLEKASKKAAKKHGIAPKSLSGHRQPDRKRPVEPELASDPPPQTTR